MLHPIESFLIINPCHTQIIIIIIIIGVVVVVAAVVVVVELKSYVPIAQTPHLYILLA